MTQLTIYFASYAIIYVFSYAIIYVFSSKNKGDMSKYYYPLYNRILNITWGKYTRCPIYDNIANGITQPGATESEK